MNLERYMELFQGRPDVFAQQQTDGTYVPVRRRITQEDYDQHIVGGRTYGIYTTTRDNRTKFIVFDIDTMDPEPRLRIFDALRKLDIPDRHILMEASGRKGWHLWLPFQSWQPAAVAFRAGRAVLQRAGVDCEVFPKQPQVGEGYGNLIKLPMGVHRVSGQYSRFYPRDSWMQVQPLHVVQLYDLADAYEEQERRPTPAIEPRGMGPYAQAALTNACARVAEAPEGQRNNQLNLEAFSLYGLVAGGVLSEDDVAANLHAAAEAAGLGAIEVARTLQSARAAGMARPLGPQR